MSGRTVALSFGLLLFGLATPSREGRAAEPDTTTIVPAPDARQSPVAIAATTLEDGTYLKIVYSSPRKRGRKIFGELVPYDEVWRTGANEATEITATRDFSLGDHAVQAGTYALFTVPGSESWTIILNRVLGQWGKYEYDPDADVLRFDVEPADPGKQYEAFTIEFSDATQGLRLTLSWDRVSVSIPVSVAGS
jgi:hypothetical protein